MEAGDGMERNTATQGTSQAELSRAGPGRAGRDETGAGTAQGDTTRTGQAGPGQDRTEKDKQAVRGLPESGQRDKHPTRQEGCWTGSGQAKMDGLLVIVGKAVTRDILSHTIALADPKSVLGASRTEQKTSAATLLGFNLGTLYAQFVLLRNGTPHKTWEPPVNPHYTYKGRPSPPNLAKPWRASSSRKRS